MTNGKQKGNRGEREAAKLLVSFKLLEKKELPNDEYSSVKPSAVHAEISPQQERFCWSTSTANLTKEGFGRLEIIWTWSRNQFNKRFILVREVNGVEVKLEADVKAHVKKVNLSDVAFGAVIFWMYSREPQDLPEDDLQ